MKSLLAAVVVLTLAGCGSTSVPPSFAPGPAAPAPSVAPGPSSAAPSVAASEPAPSTPAASAVTESPTPSIDPADFVATIDNVWFPLIPGTSWTYQGVKDGEKAIDAVTVTRDTKMVAGVACVVVHDELKVAGELAETTDDWYTQDRDGNVWYFGEATQELEGGKVTSTEGSWESSVDGAVPGIFMPANPEIGYSGLQEFYAGHAEDRFVVLLTGRNVKVPAGSYRDVMITAEWTPLEPAVLTEKAYVKGIGEIREADVAGGDEKQELVKTTAG